MKKTKDLCIGCKDDFYNGKNDLGIAECWCFKDAKVVRRFKLGWHTRRTEPGAFQEVVTLDCHYAPGQYVLEREPHRSATAVRRLP